MLKRYSIENTEPVEDMQGDWIKASDVSDYVEERICKRHYVLDAIKHGVIKYAYYRENKERVMGMDPKLIEEEAFKAFKYDPMFHAEVTAEYIYILEGVVKADF